MWSLLFVSLSGCSTTNFADGSVKRDFDIAACVKAFTDIWPTVQNIKKEFQATLTPDQKAIYTASYYPLSEVIETEDSRFGIGVLALGAKPEQQNVLDLASSIEKVVGYSFNWYSKKNISSIQVAEAHGGGAIMVDTVGLKRFSKSGQIFALMHECGHHVLGHVNQTLTNELTASYDLEYSADAWAVEKMLKADMNTKSIRYAAWELFSRVPASKGHPDGDERVKRIAEHLQKGFKANPTKEVRPAKAGKKT